MAGPKVTAVTRGRGAWPLNGTGGTLSDRGDAPGGYYRAPTGKSAMPGLIGARAARSGGACTLNEYAVYMAVRAIQQRVGADPDGVFGPDTGKRLGVWQANHGITPDEVFGPQSGKRMFRPLAVAAAIRLSAIKDFHLVVAGHIGHESWWDPGAIGVSTPADLGLGQINGPSHPDMSAEQRLTPAVSIPWVADFALANITAMKGNLRDGIAAYNLGIGGARSWVAAGRPTQWGTTNVPKYIASVLAAGADD